MICDIKRHCSCNMLTSQVIYVITIGLSGAEGKWRSDTILGTSHRDSLRAFGRKL